MPIKIWKKKKLEAQNGFILKSAGDYAGLCLPTQGRNIQEHQKAESLSFHDSQGISSSNFFWCFPKES